MRECGDCTVCCTALKVPELNKAAIESASKIGKINVEMGGTSCKVPLATNYIAKVVKMNRVGKKRK